MKLGTFVGLAGATACLTVAPLALAHDTGHDDKEISASYDFRDFDRIMVEGVYDVVVSVGEDYAITASGKTKYMEHADIRREGDVLILALKDRKNRRKRNIKKGIRVDISLPALSAVSLEGVGALEATNIDADDFDVRLEGVGSIELSGTCNSLSADMEGVGSIEARSLKCKSADVSVEGMGSAEVYASESVDADVEGIGSIDVWGKPGDVRKDKSFMSSVSIR